LEKSTAKRENVLVFAGAKRDASFAGAKRGRGRGKREVGVALKVPK